MDTGAAGHVTRQKMFPRVKLDRTSATKKFVAADGERTQDLGEKTILFNSIERCAQVQKNQECKRYEAFDLSEKVVQDGNVVVLDEKNPHIRNTRDGTVIKLDVNNGVCAMDMWVCPDESRSGFQLGKDSE